MTEDVAKTYWEHIGGNPGRGYWKKDKQLIHANILKWVEWFEKKQGLSSKEAWYNVSGKMIEENDGVGFFTASAKNSVKQSVYQLMMFIYPDYQWKPYKFVQSPQGYWKNRDNRLGWFNDFRIENGLITDEDLYKLQSTHFDNAKGCCLKFYDYSIVKLLEDLVPTKTWLPWRLAGQVPKNYWISRDNIMYWFKSELYPKYDLEVDGTVRHTNMYKLTQRIINENYGNGLLIHHFNGSVVSLLSYLYPEFNWQFWKFVSAPNSAWVASSNIKKFMKEELNIEKEEDMYTFNISDMPSTISMRFKSMIELSKYLYPSYNWNVKQFKTYGYSRAAVRFLDKLAPLINHTIMHACNGGEFKIPKTRRNADGYIKILNTIIEYHGCYYHGCPKCFPERNIFTKNTRGTYEDKYQETIKRTLKLKELGYKVVEIWECEAISMDNTYFISLFNTECL